jgi:hypothetical protein
MTEFLGSRRSGADLSKTDAIKAIGSEAEGEYAIGRDPRQMTQDELRAMGHEPMSATAAIRAHCLDCCAGSAYEVRCCMAVRCPSWPWRMGTNPWRREMSEEQREARRQIALRSGLGARRQVATIGSGAGSPRGGSEDVRDPAAAR